MIVVTHDKESAEKYGDRVITIKDGVIDTDSNDESLASDTPLDISHKEQDYHHLRYYKKMDGKRLDWNPIRMQLAIYYEGRIPE